MRALNTMKVGLFVVNIKDTGKVFCKNRKIHPQLYTMKEDLMTTRLIMTA